LERILIVEDDPKLAELLQDALKKYDYPTHIVHNFNNIMKEFRNFDPSLVLLDINLPSYDGFYWCRQIRLESTCPVIFISARTGEMDQIMALENGGDDYITKPFHPEILLAKVRSQLRRAYGEYAQRNRERIVEINGLKLYIERLVLSLNDEVINVTKKEADILEMLIERHPRVAGREDLLEKLWDDSLFIDENTLNVNITRVRNRLGELGISNAVETVRGVGYRLKISW